MKKVTQIWRKMNLAKLITILFVFLILLCVGWLTLGDWRMQTKESVKTINETRIESDQAKLSEAYGKLPLSFEVNQGQSNEQVKFLSRSSDHSVFLNGGEVVTTMKKTPVDEPSVKSEQVEPQKQETVAADAVLRMKFVGGNSEPKVAGVDELPGKVNYLIGNDPTKWKTEIPTYGKVKYTDVYPDIDAVFYGNQKNLEFDFILAPGADPKTIELAFENADKIEIGEKGDLVLNIADDQMRLKEPIIYQEIDGKRQPVTGSFVLNPKSESGNAELQTVGFRVDDYDAAKPLIIDPILAYSTYLGGSSVDSGEAIAVDAAGQAYVTGQTSSINFPLVGSLPPSVRGDGDVFVTKFSGNGSTAVYSTYFGGSDFESGLGIKVDTAGNAYLTGFTYSSNFPTLNAVQPISGGRPDAFITKLNPTGSSLIFSTYLGGSANEADYGDIAIDAATNIYVTGITSSPNFPTTSGAFQTTRRGFSDAFVTKLDATGSTISYSTFLGGSSSEYGGDDIEVDATGNAYVTGYTLSASFPTTPGAFQTTIGGMEDAYVTKLNPSGSALVYSTFLGGEDSETAEGIALDAQNQVYITGGSRSINFPTTPGAFQTTFLGGASDIFVTKLNSTGSALIYSTYIGAAGNESAKSIAIDSAGNAHLIGTTSSFHFPTANPFQLFLRGGSDAFVLKLNRTGTALIYSSYFGGTSGDEGKGIALDQIGNAYVTGSTFSDDLFVVNAFQPQPGGSPQNSDAFVAKIIDPTRKRNNLEGENSK